MRAQTRENNPPQRISSKTQPNKAQCIEYATWTKWQLNTIEGYAHGECHRSKPYFA